MRKELFFEKCTKQFNFLVTEYAFCNPQNQSDELSHRMIYLSAKTGIEISFDIREQSVFIYLHKLIQGKIVEEDLEGFTYFSIDDLLELRDPELDLSSQVSYGELSGIQLEANLLQFANVLKTHAKDLLQGDFSVFSTLQRLELQRMLE